jgi:nucleoside triphosphate pyrophosphatase
MPRDNSDIRRLVLASSSPRRRQLLPLLGLPFVLKTVGIEEHAFVGEPPTEFVLRMSWAKAFAINDVRPDELVISADTIVVLDGKVLGKPVDLEDATQMLRELRARPHSVYSAISVWHPASRRMVSELAASRVWMRDYTDHEITHYVASGDPLDKAGAYAIQHPLFDPVSRVEGCWLTVVGFPLCYLERALAQFGVVVPANVPGACRAFNQRACNVSPEILTQIIKPGT